MTILKILAVGLVLLLLYAIRDILLLLLVSMVLAAAFDPWVDWFKKKGWPRWAGIAVIYLLLFGMFALVVSLVIPPVLKQASELYANFPTIVNKLTQLLNSLESFQISGWQESLQKSFLNIEPNKTVAGLFGAVGNFFGGLFGVFAILVMTFYMVIKEDNIAKLVKLVSPEKYQKFLTDLLNHISQKMGLWLRGQLLLGLIVGLLVYVGLKIIGVKYALVLALLSAITELIPFIGPFIGAVPGVLIAFTQAPVLGLLAIGIYIGVQLLENYFITPRVMSRAVGLTPLLVIIALLIGAKLAGVLGALLAVPVALIISTILKELDNIPD